LNDDNSLLIDGSLVRMPRGYQYWEPSVFGQMFEPDIDHAAEQLKHAVANYDELMARFAPNIEETVQKFTWENVANKFISMME